MDSKKLEEFLSEKNCESDGKSKSDCVSCWDKDDEGNWFLRKLS
jgi:hypothetical protein